MDLQVMREVVTLSLSPGLNVSGRVDDDGDLVVTAMEGTAESPPSRTTAPAGSRCGWTTGGCSWTSTTTVS
jgi:hypothetical protein